VVFVLGTDEAGYAPNLGPLCIAASAWRVDEAAAAEALYDRLQAAVCTAAAEAGERVAIADSKQLYRPGGTLAALERGVLVALAALGRLPGRWRDIWRLLFGDVHGGEMLTQIDGLPWHEGFDEALPLHAAADELPSAASRFHTGCQAAGVGLLELQAAVLFPAAYNAAVKKTDNKAEVLSLTTLRLARRVLESLPPGLAIIFCDKHGGRSRYAALLQEVFPEHLVLVRQESAELGVYQVQHAGRQIEFRFQPKGERHLPTALASMTAKYLRELAMRPFNAFWQQHVPDLKPTAGYPTDAHRFYDDIRTARRKLKIADKVLWRER
jgi:ribonuclease HII